MNEITATAVSRIKDVGSWYSIGAEVLPK